MSSPTASGFSRKFVTEYEDWADLVVSGLTSHLEHVSPSQFAEKNRYLPASVTPKPGYYRYDVNPFMREIVDCFDIRSAIREVNLMKGVQTTYTTTLENVLFYYMGHVRTTPVMFMTAESELAKERIENNIMPMLVLSGWDHIIQSSDPKNTRKTGRTDRHIQWVGGGYMVPFGAVNANKMRSFSIQVMLKDEIDGWPDIVGKDGEPDRVSDDRCAAYWDRRKIFRGSTPLVKHSSKIERAYLRGDQRKYHVLCIACGFPQHLLWSGTNKKTGAQFGFVWETEDGTLLLDSVAYACSECGHKHYEHDKTVLFSEQEGAHWVPTAKPVSPDIRSYHLPAFYSPVGLQPWYKSVQAWLDAYDIEAKTVRDHGLFQVFYNNVLAKTYDVTGDSLSFSVASSLRRRDYRLGEVPNRFAQTHSEGRIQFLTCTVDVHDSNLAVAVMGWTVGRRAYLIDYWRLEGDGTDINCAATWGELDRIIESEYVADDGYKYPIAITLVDSGYMSDSVTEFCHRYLNSVHPIKGRDKPPKSAAVKEFWPFTTPLGSTAYGIMVDVYKDRWSVALRRFWNVHSGTQPIGLFNAPVDLPDKAVRELTAEVRREKKDKLTGKVLGGEWHRPGGAPNELWDLLVYSSAAVDMMAYEVCITQKELPEVDWPTFWAETDRYRIAPEPN